MKGLNSQGWATLGLTLLFCFAFSMLNPPTLSAHGVSWSLSSQKAYGFEFNFDDGTPMAFAEIKVFSPGAPEKLSQTGRTDKNGYFAFMPDADGLWLVKADDGTGHLAQAPVSVGNGGSADGDSSQTQTSAHNLDQALSKATKPLKIALVISVFINLAAIASIWRRKKNLRPA